MNLLQYETSPYLLQHKNNPVDWYPWGSAALEKAKKENKLIIVSIGYSACHWCHVMEHECFEDNEAAEVMNALYVNIKVDREERPDIDQIYMSALQLMNGNGGWPLNCILLPDGRPIYGGTYFKKADWINILSNIAAMFRNKPDELYTYADKLIEGVRNLEYISFKTNNSIPADYLVEHVKTWERFLDFENGGTLGAPKFPVPSNLVFLLRYAHLNNNEKLTNYLKTSLDNIANAGLYDQITGGIYRYSVDDVWKIPHFEKMLYDQAQMISLYAEGYAKYKNPLYLNVVDSIINFCNTELLNEKSNLYYSALDADSEGVEGKYYCYTILELTQMLSENANLFIEYFQCTEEGNFEHGLNNLYMIKDTNSFLTKHNLTEDTWKEKLNYCKQILVENRKSRVRPGLDDKQLSAWNSLMIKGLSDAYKYTGKEEYRVFAIRTLNALLSNLLIENKLFRSYKNAEVKIQGFLDDYAFLIQALLAVYEISNENKYLSKATELILIVNEEFYDSKSGMYWYTSNSSESLVARKQEYYDSVIPSSNSVMLNNLKVLALLLNDNELEEKAETLMSNIFPLMKKYPPSFSNWANYILNKSIGETEIVISGEDSNRIYLELNQNYNPHILYSFSAKADSNFLHLNRYVNGENLIYVCKNKSCQMPVNTTKQALLLI